MCDVLTDQKQTILVITDNFTSFTETCFCRQDQGSIAGPIKNGEIRPKNPNSTKEASEFLKNPT